MADWTMLFEAAVAIIAEAEQAMGGKINWTIGGGTMLNLMFGHRESHDIDIFITDPQVLLFLTPRLNAVAEAFAGRYVESSNFVKITTGEGEIDFIVAPRLTDPAATHRMIGTHAAMVETPAEILAKKVLYRAEEFTARDIFDLAFLIEKNEADVLKSTRIYRDKLRVILRRLRNHDAALRRAFDSIVRSGYLCDFDHCAAIVRQFAHDQGAGSCT